MGRKSDIVEVEFVDVQRAQKIQRPAIPRVKELITGDPGTVKAGVAYFRNGRLIAAMLVAPDKELPISMRVAALADEMEMFVHDRRVELGRDVLPSKALSKFKVRELAFGIIEFPEIYRKGPQANLGAKHDRSVLWVAAAAGAMMTAFRPVVSEIKEVLPREWKNQVEKKAHNEIVRDALEDDERVVLGDLIHDNNVIDAVGIGFQYLRIIQ